MLNSAIIQVTILRDDKDTPPMHTPLLLILSLCLTLPLCLLGSQIPANADLSPWSGYLQGKFVTGITLDARGRIWAATEEKGVWVTDPSNPAKG